MNELDNQQINLSTATDEELQEHGFVRDVDVSGSIPVERIQKFTKDVAELFYGSKKLDWTTTTQ